MASDEQSGSPPVQPRGSLQAVLFDMDGTLVDSEKVWDISLQQLADHLGGDLTPDLRASLVGSTQDQSIATLHRAFGVPADIDPETSSQFLTDATAVLLRQEVDWRPGARELLAELKAAGIPTALVTATVRSLTDLVLDGMGRHWFAATVVGDEVGRGKPAPDPYLRAAELLGVDPLHCAAIEDSDTGTTSAVAAGCAVITVPNDAPVPPGPGRTFVTSLTELDVDRLEALVAAHVASRAATVRN